MLVFWGNFGGKFLSKIQVSRTRRTSTGDKGVKPLLGVIFINNFFGGGTGWGLWVCG